MPAEGDFIEFKNWNHKFQSDITGFLDFETVQVDDPLNPEVKTLKAYQYSLIFVDKFNELLFEEREFSQEGKAGEMCLETLLKIEDQLFSHARRSKKMNMSKKAKKKAKKAKTCHICEKKFEEGEKKTFAHCHYSSSFLGMAHVGCNILR